jgi:GH15 family glucan-1,4-alpha-glucosidase
MRLEDLGLIGNCQFSALVERTGDLVWCCLPRFDSDPIFSRLLDETSDFGRFSVEPAGGGAGRQTYLENTNVLSTLFQTDTGTFRVLDFAPRFSQVEGIFHPTQLQRVVEPIDGQPVVRVRFAPRLGWSMEPAGLVRGARHLRVEGFASPVWLETDIALDDVVEQRPFALTDRKHLLLTWGSPVEQPLPGLCERYLASTIRYWQLWVKHTSIPPLWQQETIRSALALKLHCFEETGAIVAATTTSIPESPGAGRTWDYRYCWLRDAAYVLGALRHLGHFEERDHFVRYLLNIVGDAPDFKFSPLYRVDGSSELEERVVAGWPGFANDGPVRVGNGAALHVQNDVFGELLLALSPLYLDDRFADERSRDALALLERLAEHACAVVGTPDAGIWEYRTEWKPQTFSSLMSWAGANRMSVIAARHTPGHRGHYEDAAARIRELIIAEAWSERLGSFAGTHGGDQLDAALLQMAPLRILPASDPKLLGTIDAIGAALSQEGWLYRYHLDDGFGRPSVAFVLCTFWMIEALAATSRAQEARALMERVRAAMSPLGLMAEDYAPSARRMWGNFPQAYSHAGLIHGAFAASPRWLDLA